MSSKMDKTLKRPVRTRSQGRVSDGREQKTTSTRVAASEDTTQSAARARRTPQQLSPLPSVQPIRTIGAIGAIQERPLASTRRRFRRRTASPQTQPHHPALERPQVGAQVAPRKRSASPPSAPPPPKVREWDLGK